MTDFTRFNRKAALLLAKLGERDTRRQKKIPELGGITVNAVRFWRRSEAEYRGSLTISDHLKTFLGISDQRNLLSNEVAVKEPPRLLGYFIQQ